MPSWFSLLANVASSDVTLDVPRHSRPIVYCRNMVISLSVTAVSCFSNSIVNFAHNVHLQGLRNHQLIISVPVLKIYQSISSDLILAVSIPLLQQDTR